MHKFDFVADEVVVIFRLREIARATKQAIHLFSAASLPRFQKGGQQVSAERFNHDMRVFRHHAPRGEAVAFAVEMAQGIGCALRELGPPQLAAPLRCVEEQLDPRGKQFARTRGRGR